MGWADCMVGAKLIEVTSVPAGWVGAMEMEVTSGEPVMVVTSCATGNDMDIGCGIEDGGTAIVIVMVAPCCATVAAGIPSIPPWFCCCCP